MTISADEARWMLGFYGLPGGEKPPGFRTKLIEAIAHADPGNRDRLRLGFPGLVAAFEAQLDVSGLQAIAGSADPPYVCPRCDAVSHHPTDRAEGYCGACHKFADFDARMER